MTSPWQLETAILGVLTPPRPLPPHGQLLNILTALALCVF